MCSPQRNPDGQCMTEKPQMRSDSTCLFMANMQQAKPPPFPFVPISRLSNLLTPKQPFRPDSRCVLAIRVDKTSHVRQDEIYNNRFREILTATEHTVGS